MSGEVSASTLYYIFHRHLSLVLHTFISALLLGSAWKMFSPVFSGENQISSVPCPGGFSGFHIAKLTSLGH